MTRLEEDEGVLEIRPADLKRIQRLLLKLANEGASTERFASVMGAALTVVCLAFQGSADASGPMAPSRDAVFEEVKRLLDLAWQHTTDVERGDLH